jgi:pilus assembly protein CpaB
MNTSRLIVLGLAAVAAGGAAFLARGLLGGGTPAVSAAPTPPPIATSQVLVAASDLQPGQALTDDQVRWEKWPTSSVDPSFITRSNNSSSDDAIRGTVARTPIVAGEPLTNVKIIHADAASFMSAKLSPGMRAVSIGVSVASVAGGFILPNDRVDLILTEQISDTPRRFRARTVISDVRVLAIDQAFDNKNQKAVSDAKTATLELTPAQAEEVVRAQATGTVSLTLRALGDGAFPRLAKGQTPPPTAANDGDSGAVSIIRYGVGHSGSTGQQD